jgi:hypothetical protein
VIGMATDIERTWKCTADEWGRMVELGIFGDDERLELIEGEIVEMAPIGDPHGRCVSQRYRAHRRAASGETVAPAAFPDVVVTVADVFA